MTHKKSCIATLLIVTALLVFVSIGHSEEQKPTPLDFDTMLMWATFRIGGPNSTGTAFLMGRPYHAEKDKFRYTLVTATHVLEGIKGEFANLYFRRHLEHGKWEILPMQLRIREGGNNLWVSHPKADVTAMYIGVPENALVTFIPMAMLADDDLLSKYNIHPGDLLNCLGYPLGVESNPGGFPILRSGKIASYPLLPTTNTISFLLDFRVFPGNSGGPVYISFTGDRIYDNAIHGTSFNFVMGLVSEEIRLTETRQQLYSYLKEETPLGLAKIIHASLIRETIALLPPPTP